MQVSPLLLWYMVIRVYVQLPCPWVEPELMMMIFESVSTV